jgi:stage II sporulation protein GA (sporulation sigma-E factor processing peptidase)
MRKYCERRIICFGANLKTVVVYADILMLLNLFVDYFLLSAVSKFLYLKPGKRRLILGALLGSVYSLYIFFPEQNAFWSFLIKFTMALTMVCVVFGISRPILIKTFLCFGIIRFMFFGFSFAMWMTLRPNGMIIRNSVVYLRISPLVLVLSTLAAYIIIEMSNRIIGRHVCEEAICRVKITIFKKSDVFEARLDTGNNLKEPFSNLPVILANKKCLQNVLPQNINFEDVNSIENSCEKWRKILRLVPFDTISEGGMLVAFKPDCVIIETKKNKTNRNVYVAICNKIEGALIGSEMAERL